MTNVHTSLMTRKRRRINDICAKMRAATEVASSGMAHIIDMMQAERAAHMAEADKLGKAIALLQGL